MRQVRSEWRAAQANPARLARSVAGSNAHAGARERKAKRASMKCSTIEAPKAQCMSPESGLSTPTPTKVSRGAVDVVASDRVECDTSAEHRPSEGTLDTSGADHGEGLGGFGSGQQQVRETLKGTSKEQSCPHNSRERVSMPANARELIKKAFVPHKPREPLRIDTSDNRYHYSNKLREAIGKYCGQAVGAIKMHSIYTRRMSCYTS